jgi:hypothetical protein
MLIALDLATVFCGRGDINLIVSNSDHTFLFLQVNTDQLPLMKQGKP